MAGRGIVEASDTIADKRILLLNKNNELILAKEPLHFYDSPLTGLDCGVSFARELLKNIPDSITVAVIPTAIGGSTVGQWLGDSLHRDVHLLSNFNEKLRRSREIGTLKGILWHQGESDAHEELIPTYGSSLQELFGQFRVLAKNDSLPILVAELGGFYPDQDSWNLIIEAIHEYADSDKNCFVILTVICNTKETACIIIPNPKESWEEGLRSNT